MVAANPLTKDETALRFPEVKTQGERFWIGLTKNCPIQSAGPFVGILFQKETAAIQRDEAGNPEMDEAAGGSTKMRYRDGNTAVIDAETMAGLARALPEVVIQSFAIPDLVNAQGVVLEKNRRRSRWVRKARFEFDAASKKWVRYDSPRYQHIEGEVPLTRFLFILPAEDRGRFDDTRPPTVGS